MNNIKIAIIGTGGFAVEHAKAYKRISEAILKGVYGTDPDRRGKFAKNV